MDAVEKVFNDENSQVSIPFRELQNLLTNKSSGRLIIDDPNDESVQWRVYLGDGKVHFATSSMGQRERLSYLLGRYFSQHQFSIPTELPSDYQYLCRIWQAGQLSVQEVRKILAQLTQEALIQCLALPRAIIEFENTVGLDPLLLSIDLKKLIVPARKQIRSWVQLRSQISSPFQRPSICDLNNINNQELIHQKEYHIVEQFRDFFNDNLCLYEIASLASMSTLELALVLNPLIKGEIIKTIPYKKLAKKQDERPLIACIDDSNAIQRIVKMTLEAGGFKVISIVEPAKAMTTFVRNKPDLILMDINMPEIDGYKLSYMLRQSNLLKDIPIIMLTGRNGVLDKVKAKMVGAVSYISKPFNPQELVKTVDQNVKLAQKE